MLGLLLCMEADHLTFFKSWDWFISYNDIFVLWKAQPSFIFVQLLVVIGAITTLVHALQNQGRLLYLWSGIILHGLIIEITSYSYSDIDNFWHSQTPIIFFGRRLPLHIIFVYVIFIYPAVITVDKFKLPKYSEPLAVGLVTVLIDYPYDIVGIRFMHWTWHDTDPNISDRHYNVPWNSFYFHATFSASFIYFFYFTRFVTFGEQDLWKASTWFFKELGCTVIAAFLGMPGGVILFIFLYHPLHDNFNIHSEVTFFLLVIIYVTIIFLSTSENLHDNTLVNIKTTNCIVLAYLCAYYLVFIGIVAFMDPASEMSTGWHEQIGPCNESVIMQTALGKTLIKKKFLCPNNHTNANYFGWSCLPHQEAPKDGIRWYTICGTPLHNRVEYVVLLIAAAIFSCSFFFKMLYSHKKIDCKPIKEFENRKFASKKNKKKLIQRQKFN